MPFLHGKNTHVYLNSGDISPYLTNTELSVEMETADATAYGTTWRSSVVGIPGSKIDFAGLYDPTTSALTTMVTTSAQGVLTICPGGGTAIGDRARLFTPYDSNYDESPPVGGAVAIKGSWLADGIVGFGDVLHPLAEDTNTTTGAEKDDTAATSLGWVAHLHVTAVDAGSWVIKLQDAAVTNTYTDLTGGAFTAVTVPTSQRLVSATATTTLRRFVRYVATRTGGAGGDGITFQLSYARNS